MNHSEDGAAWSREEFEQQLWSKGRFYHIHHPFHVAMTSGECTPEQIRGWVANRFYYQSIIPIKDAAILSNCPDRNIRRIWLQRILDHDGRPDGSDAGGIEAWLRLGEAVSLQRESLQSFKLVLPGVRFACDSYLNFARTACWQDAVCSSLTELFAPAIHQSRLDHWPRHYPWIERQGYDYFRRRLSEVRADVRQGLSITLDHFKTRSQQNHALDILQLKLDVLWSMLDAMRMAYVHNEPPYHSVPSES